MRLSARLGSLARVEKDDLRGFSEAVAAFEKDSGTVLAEEQRLAVEQAARSPLLVVTGGPGVGKTTIVKAILSVFDRAKVVTRLAAPTGRAAKRMSEATGREAATLHRLLEFDPKKSAFKRDAKSPIEAGAIIVDESSMVDVWMADALTQAMADGARLVLVGDVDQLPSVGPGAFLRDAIDSGVVPCVRLVKIFRQAEKSLIVQNAHRINAGEPPVVPEAGDTSSDFFVVEKRDADEARRVILELVTNRIPRRFGLDPVRDMQVLTPMNRGPAGTSCSTRSCRRRSTRRDRRSPAARRAFRLGDKVMQLRNDYDKRLQRRRRHRRVGRRGRETLVVRFADGGAQPKCARCLTTARRSTSSHLRTRPPSTSPRAANIRRWSSRFSRPISSCCRGTSSTPPSHAASGSSCSWPTRGRFGSRSPRRTARAMPRPIAAALRSWRRV